MRLSDGIQAIVLAAVAVWGVHLSVAAVADPPRLDEPAGLESMTGQDVEKVLDAALGASLDAMTGHPGNLTRAATLRSRT